MPEKIKKDIACRLTDTSRFIQEDEPISVFMVGLPGAGKTEVSIELLAHVEASANYTASSSDVVTLSKLIGDLGGVGVKAYVKTYKGKPHIILKGRPGLRKVLTGTKYGIKNPKVITMGLGRAGAVNAARMGGIFSVVLLTTYRVVDYFLTDQATLTRLVGYLAIDIVKVGITTGVSIAVASAITGGVVFAIGPILAIVIVGFIATAALNSIDEQYKISDSVVAGLDKLTDNTVDLVNTAGKEVRDKTNDAIDTVIDYTVESAQRILFNFAQHSLHKFLSGIPRLY